MVFFDVLKIRKLNFSCRPKLFLHSIYLKILSKGNVKRQFEPGGLSLFNFYLEIELLTSASIYL